MTVEHEPELLAELADLTRRLEAAQPYNIGFPGAVDFDYTPLARLFTSHLLNNIGDPFVDGVAANHTKAMEREVVSTVADLLRADPDDRWGYVTSGGTEGNLHALHLARDLHRDGVVYHSDQAHYSIDKAIGLLGLPSVRIRTNHWGDLDYDDLTAQLDRRRERPAIVVATAGTTMTEAVDDVRRIAAILNTLAVRRRYVHVDAALSGIPLALLDPRTRPGFDLADGADSVAVSGHKFLGSPLPCGVVIVRASNRERVARPVGYTATPDATISGSRSGHAPLVLWYALRRHGLDGLRRRADRARELAAYTHQRLSEIGWPAHRHPYAFTVVLRTPPETVTKKWVLAGQDQWSHIITMPGLHADQIDEFVADLLVSTKESAT
jgi:histidine decarboxylase